MGLHLYASTFASPFVYDDFILPLDESPVGLLAWVTRVRPFLMFTYWLNTHLLGDSPLGYHFLNLVIHALNTGLAFLVLQRLLSIAAEGRSPRHIRTAAILGAAVFFVHPLQTESVSYIAGRSESLESFFVLLAYIVFLYRRRQAISWLETAAVLTLFVFGLCTKENAIALVPLLVLTDIFWPAPFSVRGLRANWRIYAALGLAALAASWKIFQILTASASAGFSIHAVTWYQYAFTEARAFFTYLRLSVIPTGQSIDHYFPVSHNVFEFGAIYYLIALVALVALAIFYRKRHPVACFGLLLTLVLLAPTSSFIPIQDPLVERRMYLPLLGFILIACELARHLRLQRRTGYAICTVVLAAFYILCYQRNLSWEEPSRLFVEAAQDSPTGRPYLNLVKVLAEEHKCPSATPYLQAAEKRLPNDYMVQLAWARAFECVGQKDAALQRLFRAARISPNADVFTLIGNLYGEMGKPEQAGVYIHKAVALDPKSPIALTALKDWDIWMRELQRTDAQPASH